MAEEAESPAEEAREPSSAEEPAPEKPAAEEKKRRDPGRRPRADRGRAGGAAAERRGAGSHGSRRGGAGAREAALAGEAEEEPAAASRAPAKIEGDARYLATGKRKTSVARVTLLPGSGKFEVNNRSLEEFFPRPLHQTMARQPLAITGYEGNVDVRVRVHGGGISGQAGAVRHGIARALIEVDPELRGELKRRGFLTRDARAKERRKAGLKKARKRPQFSKR